MRAIWNIRRYFSPLRHISPKVDIATAAHLNYGTHHRSGWNEAIWQAQRLHVRGGVLVDAFLERTLLWGESPGEAKSPNPKPHTRPWIGFAHNPSEMPDWYCPETHPQNYFRTDLWQKSEPHCRGLFAMSQKEQIILAKKFSFPVEIIRLPTETPRHKFSADAFLKNTEKKILQVGYWLRKLHSIYFLRAPGWKKWILPGLRSLAEKGFEIEQQRFQYDVDPSSVTWRDHVKSVEYDRLLSENIVFLDLYDASANNAVVECIVRSTPLLVNRIPAVVEYLGEDYPYYFNHLDEAAAKATDLTLALEAHEHLKRNPIKKTLTFMGFLEAFANSQIYRNLQ